MRIKKIGHCCLRIEAGGAVVLTDPGNFTSAQDDERGIDAIIITHEHADHLHVPSLEAVLSGNPGARILCNGSVGAILNGKGISWELLEDGGKATVAALSIEGFGRVHAPIHESVRSVENTGFLIGGTLFYPGDAFVRIGRAVECLALPVAGPWLRSSDAIAYAQAVAPRQCFPVHDGMLNAHAAAFYRVPERALQASGIRFTPLGPGEEVFIQ